MSTTPKFLSVTDACRVLGVGRTTLYKLNSLGKLKFSKLLGKTLIAASEIERLSTEIEAGELAQ
ncbi:hypothetical protein ASE36_19015 [Rhizobium sp. Root274]|uniref:helix-turn-helix domain-containing protein n=1 Tax=unclassified Rhizobium TaxID=2613769 RepID=UPI000715379F|nr:MULTISPECIES: helix-turn-helix domain-containing protein [unclassified Rhizobium]KQW27027.1 hypothetical protein ASC71_20060 [Rhizobium sp. Root1240]KRD27911.1 hypothetical protein ASE36_19015 [Rhizobium sp. Root274]